MAMGRLPIAKSSVALYFTLFRADLVCVASEQEQTVVTVDGRCAAGTSSCRFFPGNFFCNRFKILSFEKMTFTHVAIENSISQSQNAFNGF